MASMSIERASSSSPSSFDTPRWTYDVFLSFRGKDTRNNFTDHLFDALKRKGIFTFRDDEKLERGKSISPELEKAIEESRFSVVILSRNYAFSTWCLEELAKIVGCMKVKGMTVLPIFYNVDPSDVRKQMGTFAQAFVEHEKRCKIEEVEKWRDALIEVANLSGWDLKDRPETEIIQKIVKLILNKLSVTFSVDTKGLVGIDARVEKLKSLLALGLNNVRIIGIWGTGGMGKTTLARVVYGMVSNQFEACSFITDVREVYETHGLLQLQKTLLNELLMEKDVNIVEVDNGVFMIKNRLRHKKILLVLDDVNELEQLMRLAGENDWFGPGSRVIITTRDEHLLKSREVDGIYEAKGLDYDESFHLFNLKAFKKEHPTEDYLELSQAFVNYANGLPLAIEVLGSSLFTRSIDEWKNELNRLKEFPNGKTLNVLRRSYDGLEQTEKEIFLNIACFFNHKDQVSVTEKLVCLDLYPIIGLRVLIDKSLIKLHGNQLWMHDLLQEMGRDIVRQECPKDPGKRSRLWLHEDIHNVLTKNTGTKAVEGIVLKLCEPKRACWNLEAFSKMKSLKVLEIHNVDLLHGPKILPNSLRLLEWSCYPSKSLPVSFQPDGLVELRMCSSKIERLWQGRKSLEKLKVIQLENSIELIETPDFTEIPNLEELVLENCINLPGVHPSIGVLKKLKVVSLKGCKNLKSLPSKFEMESLEILILSGCSKLKKFPELGRNMERVCKLCLDGTTITKLPTSIENLTGLASLKLKDCKNLVCVPSIIFNLKLLKDVDISGCSKFERLPENLGNAESVEELDVSGTAIRHVPSSIGLLENLRRLSFQGCKGLSSSNKSWYELIPFYSKPTSPDPVGLSPLLGLCSLTKLNLSDCNLKAIPNDIGSLFSLEHLNLDGNKFVCLPESIGQLSNLKWMWVNNCTSLRSLSKLPSNIEVILADNCISLEMLPDLLKLNDSFLPYFRFQNCLKLADNQCFTDVYFAAIKKLGLSSQFSNDRYRYDLVIPGSEIPEWFTHQSMGDEANIKEPSNLCNEWMGIAACVVFRLPPSHQINNQYGVLSFWLTSNGKRLPAQGIITIPYFLSDHLSLLYLSPSFYEKNDIKLLWECDSNGFSQIGIRIKTEGLGLEVKKSGFRMVYKKDIEDLNRITAQCSNNIITPYDGIDVLHHNFDNSTVVAEGNKIKSSRDDYDGAGPSGEGSSNDVPHAKRIERLPELMAFGNSDCKESSDSD
ncbi:TMV resistance protein N-like [Fagus crenata]